MIASTPVLLYLGLGTVALFVWLLLLSFAVSDYNDVKDRTLTMRQDAARDVLKTLLVGGIFVVLWPLVVVGYGLKSLHTCVRDAFFLDTTHEEGSDA